MRLRDPFLRVLRTAPVLNAVSAASSAHPRVLMWHRFGPETTDRVVGVELFDAQMRVLREHFTAVSVSELCRAVTERRRQRNVVAVTIDDGYEDFFHYALPVLARHKIPATLYATSAFVDQRLWLWPDVLRYAIEQTGQAVIECSLGGKWVTFELRSADERERAWNTLADHALTLDAIDASEFIRSAVGALKANVPETPTPEFRAMTWDQLRQVAAAGVEIGGHTCTHPLLTKCDQSQVAREVADSKAELEGHLQAPVQTLAYPHGICDEMVRKATRQAGYLGATSGTGPDYRIQDVFDIKRYGSGHDMTSFRNAVYGVRFAAARCGIQI